MRYCPNYIYILLNINISFDNFSYRGPYFKYRGKESQVFGIRAVGQGVGRGLVRRACGRGIAAFDSFFLGGDCRAGRRPTYHII